MPKIKKTDNINKILFGETKSEFEYPYQNWYFPLKKSCKKIIDFDTRWNWIAYGKEGMNKKFLEFIKREKPDHVFLWVVNDKFYFDTFLKIREISFRSLRVMIVWVGLLTESLGKREGHHLPAQIRLFYPHLLT